MSDNFIAKRKIALRVVMETAAKLRKKYNYSRKKAMSIAWNDAKKFYWE
jgi:hypothetical protein